MPKEIFDSIIVLIVIFGLIIGGFSNNQIVIGAAGIIALIIFIYNKMK